MRRERLDLKLPKEHGAWAMLYVSLAVGALVGTTEPFRPVQLLLFLLSVTFVFTARESLVEWLRARIRRKPSVRVRRMMLIYLLLGALPGSLLILVYKYFWLLPLMALTAVLLACNSWLAIRRQDRTVIGEAIAILGLTLTAPAAYYASRGQWDTRAWLTWVLCALYFTSSVFYVKLRVHWLSRRRDEKRRTTWRQCATYHSLLSVALLVLASTGNLSFFVVIAFVPVLLRSFWRLARPASQANLKRIGLFEIFYSIVFLIFVTLTFRIP